VMVVGRRRSGRRDDALYNAGPDANRLADLENAHALGRTDIFASFVVARLQLQPFFPRVK
jgi:hypothetical protein